MPSDRQATRTTEPASTPVTLAEAKAYMKVDFTDAPNDAIITMMIESATSRVESYTRRALIEQTWEYWASRPGGDVDENQLHPDYPLELALSSGRGSRIYLPYPPLLTVTEISTFAPDDTETVFASSNYLVVTESTPGYVALNDGISWPTNLRASAGFKIVFTAGFGDEVGDVPSDIKLAVLTLVTEAYDNRGLSRTGGPTGGVAKLPVQLKDLIPRWRFSRMGGVL